MPSSKLSETARLSAIRKHLGLFSTVRIWRNNTGMHGRVRYGLDRGSCDLIGVVQGGRFFALEVKVPGKEPTEEQEDFMREVRRMGGFATVVHDPQEAIAALGRALRGDTE